MRRILSLLFVFAFLLFASASSPFSYASNSKNATVCSTYKKIYNPSPSSSFCNGGECPYYIQTCVTEKDGLIIPSINYSGPVCTQLSIQLIDTSRSNNKAVSTKNMWLSCESVKSTSIRGNSVMAIGLHVYRTQIVTGPWHETEPSSYCINVVNPVNDSCLKVQESPDLKAPLTSPFVNRFYTPVFKVHGKGNYR